MMTGRRAILDGNEFNHFFPKAEFGFKQIKRNADLNNTVALMEKVIRTTTQDTQNIARILKANTEFETLKKVWEFTFKYLQYKKDKQGVEQVRRPCRSWWDRHTGVDCDCMTVFIASILTNLKIPFRIRLAGYGMTQNFEHVYVVAILGDRKIIMDTVVHEFNKEVKPTFKKDLTMELEYLNGFDEENQPLNTDQEALLLFSDGNGFGSLFKKKEENKNLSLKERIKKGFHAVNKINPVTALLRAGILASMKLNVGKVARKLRYTYWSKEQALSNNMHLEKWQKLTEIRLKLERIFYGAGGKVENLKKSILEGKGNKDKKVALNGFEDSPYINTSSSRIDEIIGRDLYNDEFDEYNQSSVNGLGEAITTASAIATASSVVALISEFIKKLGDLFKSGTPQAEAEIIEDNTKDEIPPTVANELIPVDPPTRTVANSGQTLPLLVPESEQFNDPENTLIESRNKELYKDDATTKSTTESGGLMQWIKDHPVLTAGILVVGVGGTIWAVKAYKKNQKTKNLNGVTASKKKGGKGKQAYPTFKTINLN